jgi:hypothetical protein
MEVAGKMKSGMIYVGVGHRFAFRVGRIDRAATPAL